MNKTILTITTILFFASLSQAEDIRIDLNKIMMIESSGDPLAFNPKENSTGLFQISPICLKDWNNLHPKKHFAQADLWDEDVNRKIADWCLNVRIPQMLKHYGKPDTIENRITAYNAGISYVVKGKELPKITKNYIKKYLNK